MLEDAEDNQTVATVWFPAHGHPDSPASDVTGEATTEGKGRIRRPSNFRQPPAQCSPGAVHRTAGMLTITDGHLVEGTEQVGYILSEAKQYRDPAISLTNQWRRRDWSFCDGK